MKKKTPILNTLIYTDGSCIIQEPRKPGGWGYIMINQEEKQQVLVSESFGSDLHTTNQKMELEAVIRSLKAVSRIKTAKNIILHSDSKYILGGINSWISTWKKNKWLTINGESVKNQDRWKQIDTIIENLKDNEYQITCLWIKAHSGNKHNNKADKLAKKGAINAKDRTIKHPKEEVKKPKIIKE